ncbi:unnamed protein product [Linum tenue]|uniref:Homeobox domain-containing protein n=1 Tax=Linum tenue TaxID=586396 RepID=A0AAV0KTM4_9ROSI|nr:unnamed protein product [Linum tenue]
MGVVSMKVHRHLPPTTTTTTTSAFFWEQQDQQQLQPPSLSLSFPAQHSSSTKRLRPLAPKLASPPPPPPSSFDLKSFIRPESGARRASTSPSDDNNNKHSATATSQHPGGTRWNPTQEQIGILEMLYRGGMRTPNAQQIEQITSQLGRYGKIEGKNVFYWFQNHKARERQKQKRTSLGLLSHSPRSASTALDIRLAGAEMTMSPSPCKRKCRSWGIQPSEVADRQCNNYYYQRESSGGSSNSGSSGGGEEDDEKVTAVEEAGGGGGDRTLELFPLHPEGRGLSPSSS